ncbi:hypothetical protein B7Z17_02440 [Candidatus Saccharibacteria bacterium 32-49-10]|nr:MAG: hypothetical protein B7Z17_02440 [Candidatus Saccharibacteria bacterium 32-49-10]
MNLLEYEAKDLLKESGVPIAASIVVTKESPLKNISAPVVVKSQVPVGGRGKLGGIKIVDSGSDLPMIISRLFELDIKGFKPSSLLLEDKISIAREFYLSLVIDRQKSCIQVMGHAEGGVEIEGQTGFSSWDINGDPAAINRVGENLAEIYDIPDQVFTLQELVKNTYDCFVQNDATLLEINPLILTNAGDLIAGDCKMTLDDAAAFRHPEWNFEQTSKEVNFVSLDEDGTVGIIANGAGLAMATVDAVADAGMRPANFLDVGGGANAASVLAAFRRIMEYRGVKAIVINIFAGITRCDEVARAIIEAKEQIADLPPLCIRLAGTNYTEAKVLLDDADISLLPTLKECLDTAKKEVSRGQ